MLLIGLWLSSYHRHFHGYYCSSGNGGNVKKWIFNLVFISMCPFWKMNFVDFWLTPFPETNILWPAFFRRQKSNRHNPSRIQPRQTWMMSNFSFIITCKHVLCPCSLPSYELHLTKLQFEDISTICIRHLPMYGYSVDENNILAPRFLTNSHRVFTPFIVLFLCLFHIAVFPLCIRPLPLV